MDFLHPDIEAYALQHTEPESETLQALNRETYAKVLQPRMLSGHMQGRILSMLSHVMQPKRILEIGTYTGYSALCLAEGLQADGVLHTIDINEELETLVRKHMGTSGFSDKIKLHFGDARDIIKTLTETWDIVFIDADKENYSAYFDLTVDMVRKGGIIIADNVLWSGKVLHQPKKDDTETEALQAFSKKVCADPRVSALLLPVRDGLQILRKN